MNFFIVLTLFALASTTLAGLIGKGKDANGVANLGIVHGTKSAVMKPYLVSIRKYGGQICGGTILNERVIVTAAHCLQSGLPASAYSIGVGHTNLLEQTVYNVIKYVYHNGYSSGIDYNNDIALMYLSTPIVMKQFKVQPVRLPECKTAVPPYGESATVSGWGALSENNYGSDDLYETTIKVLKETEEGCKAYSNWRMLSDTMFCAGYADGHTDSCQGDSGGPLVDKYNQLIGVVSWGIGCAKSGQSGVYTNVCKMIKWINNPNGQCITTN